MKPSRTLTSMCLALSVTLPAAVNADDADTALAAGRYSAAVEIARRSLAGEAATGHDWHVLGDALWAMGQTADASAAYRNALEDDAGHALQIGVAASRILHLRGEFEQAARQLARVLDDALARADALHSAELVAAGDAARLLGQEDPARFRRALVFYEQAIARDADNLAARVALADLLLEKYNNTEALELYRGVLAVDPDFTTAVLGLARSQYFDHSRAALDTARRALELQPSLVPARVLVARLLLEMDEPAAADEELEQALEVNPGSPAALTLRMMIRYLADDEGGYDALQARLDEIAPGYRERYATLAEIAAQKRLYREAAGFAREAVARFPSHWRARGLLGVNRLRLGQVDAGRRDLEAAFRGDPFNVWIKNTLDLLDRVGEFSSMRRGRFILVARERDVEVLAPLLFPLAEAAYDEFTARYRHEPPTPVRIEVYPNHDDFSVRTVGLVGIEILGVSFGPTLALISPSADSPGSVNWGSVLWHELAHTFHLSLSNSRVPRWFTEGLAVAEEHRARPGWGADVTPDFLEAYNAGRMPAASALNAVFTRPSYPQQVAHAYFQASLIVEFIEEQHGIEAIRAMLDGFKSGKSTAAVLAEELDLTRYAFDRAFEAWVRTRFAGALSAMMDAEPSFAALWRAGADALRNGDLGAAESALQDARRKFPQFATADSPYHLLAQTHLRRGDRPAAIGELESVVAVDADHLEVHRQLAALYLDERDEAGAAGILERALYINPFDVEMRHQLAAIHESNSAWERALAERAAVSRLDPLDPAAAHYRHANALARTGRYPAARREVLRALEIAPLYDEALELLLAVRAALDQETGSTGSESAE